MYRVDTTPMREVDQWLETFRRNWVPRLDALATEIARGKQRRAPTPHRNTKESAS